MCVCVCAISDVSARREEKTGVSMVKCGVAP